MIIKVNTENLLNLTSNLLIRLRMEKLDESGDLRKDLTSFVKYLEKFSGDQSEILFDKNFITSREECSKLVKVIVPIIPEIKEFQSLLETMDVKPTISETNMDLVKEYLRKIAAMLISFKNNSN